MISAVIKNIRKKEQRQTSDHVLAIDLTGEGIFKLRTQESKKLEILWKIKIIVREVKQFVQGCPGKIQITQDVSMQLYNSCKLTGSGNKRC